VLRQGTGVAALKIGVRMDLRPLLLGLKGRIDRRTWWLWGVAAPLGLALYFTVVLRVAGLPARATDVAVNLLLLWPTLAVSVKRWHDRGKSGWWLLAALIPFVGWIWVLVENGLLRGDAGTNRFGEPPTADQ
jgi:uncharacterized membrane protein YhaH (DUF805 family)